MRAHEAQELFEATPQKKRSKETQRSNCLRNALWHQCNALLGSNVGVMQGPPGVTLLGNALHLVGKILDQRVVHGLKVMHG